MDSSFWFDTIKLGIVHSTYLGVSGYSFHKTLYKDLFYLYNHSVEPDEMQHYASFGLDLHSLQTYLFRPRVS